MVKDNSYIRVEGTSPLDRGRGGIWEINLGDHGHLDFVDGQVDTISLATYSTATLSGGRIDQIWSGQAAYTHVGWPIPHIEIVCDLDSINYNTVTKKLTGNWLDGTGFNIQLIDVSGQSPAIENIFFTLEPATLLLVGTGGLLLRRKRR